MLSEKKEILSTNLEKKLELDSNFIWLTIKIGIKFQFFLFLILLERIQKRRLHNECTLHKPNTKYYIRNQ